MSVEPQQATIDGLLQIEDRFTRTRRRRFARRLGVAAAAVFLQCVRSAYDRRGGARQKRKQVQHLVGADCCGRECGQPRGSHGPADKRVVNVGQERIRQINAQGGERES